MLIVKVFSDRNVAGRHMGFRITARPLLEYASKGESQTLARFDQPEPKKTRHEAGFLQHT
jgi:hypothetical protein